MGFVVVIKKINTSINPDIILDTMNKSSIPIGNNIKYYKQYKINTEKNTYRLYIKYNSFNKENKNMVNFHDELIKYKWIKIRYANSINFKVSMKDIDYYNYIYKDIYYIK